MLEEVKPTDEPSEGLTATEDVAVDHTGVHVEDNGTNELQETHEPVESKTEEILAEAKEDVCPFLIINFLSFLQQISHISFCSDCVRRCSTSCQGRSNYRR